MAKYYFLDIPSYVMDEIVAGMIDGKPEPTPEDVKEWLTADLEHEGETLPAQYC